MHDKHTVCTVIVPSREIYHGVQLHISYFTPAFYCSDASLSLSLGECLVKQICSKLNSRLL